MEQFTLTKIPLETPPNQQWSSIPQLTSQEIAHQPDAHWLLIADNSQLVGRCSLWWQNTPHLPGHKVGLIGHYAAIDTTAASHLLQHTLTELASQGCTLAIGPIDGSTWHRYRLLSERGVYPTFFLEPDNPDDWVSHFLNQGFTTIAKYSSGLVTNLTQTDSRLQQITNRLNQLDIKIRPVNLQSIQTEFKTIYTIASQSFRNNFLYTPISEAEFIAQYHPLQPYLRPELILIAEHNHHPVGFLFAIPDWLQKQRGELINTVIIKTVAVLPQRIYAGLGNLLVAQCHSLAHQLGYQQAIHALMHDANPSINLSRRYGQTIRRYALFAKQITIAF